MNQKKQYRNGSTRGQEKTKGSYCVTNTKKNRVPYVKKGELRASD